MNTIINIILLGTALLSVVPFVHLMSGKREKNYRCLQMLVIATVIWTFLILMERIAFDMTTVYIAHMLGYPLKFLMATFMLCTIYQYTNRLIKSYWLVILGFLFLVEVVIASTNHITRGILDVVPSEMTSFEALYTSQNGWMFNVHLIIVYLVLLYAITYLFVYLRKRRDMRHYKEISRTMTISVIVVLLANILQITLLKSNVDITYISLIFVTFMLYRVIYKKDIIFNLRISGRGEILSNMREMYILMDNQHRIVEISPMLCNKYGINEEQFVGMTKDSLLQVLEKDVILYTEYDIQEEDNPDKDHLHLREKQFKLRGMDEYGHMALLYDETKVFELLSELNRLSNYDTMTGLHNRNYMERTLKEKQFELGTGVLSLDLNGLKINNDYIGHKRGDFLLQELASIMKTTTKEFEQKELARIGGDEFLIILPKTTKEELSSLKQELLNKASSDDIMNTVSVSVGTALMEKDEQDIFDIIHEADQNMYKMKKEVTSDYVKELLSHIKETKNTLR